VITFESPELTIGHVSSGVSGGEKEFLRRLFAESRMKLTFMDDMQSWYRCHAAFVLPIAYLCYCHRCNLRTCTYQDVKAYIRSQNPSFDMGRLTGCGTACLNGNCCTGNTIKPSGSEIDPDNERYVHVPSGGRFHAARRFGASDRKEVREDAMGNSTHSGADAVGVKHLTNHLFLNIIVFIVSRRQSVIILAFHVPAFCHFVFMGNCLLQPLSGMGIPDF
jgi:hypothetical protein